MDTQIYEDQYYGIPLEIYEELVESIDQGLEQE